MKLTRLHEEFLDRARRPMSFGGLPVTAQPVEEVPIVVSSKWRKDEGCLIKTYQFRLLKQRNNFMKELFNHEEAVKHNASISIEEDSVTIKLQTKGVGSITELDKEYAKWADELYRDTVYSQSHG